MTDGDRPYPPSPERQRRMKRNGDTKCRLDYWRDQVIKRPLLVKGS